MKTRLTEITDPALVPIAAQVQQYLKSAKSQSTRDAYRRDWEHFSKWCDTHQLEALPAIPETIALYVTAIAGQFKPSTLTRRLATISVKHQSQGFQTPTAGIIVRNTLSGIRRQHGVAQTRKSPIRAVNIRMAVKKLSSNPRDLRDKAILLIGYVGALRRSELVALDAEDVEFVEQGLRLTIRHSKTDQEGTGVVMGIGYGASESTCPVRALRSWIDAAKIMSGPVFRPVSSQGRIGDTRLCDKSVSLIIKRLASELGLDSADISSHSMRAGLITDLYAAGTAEAIIMERSRHKSHSVMSVYRREADMFSFNYAAAAGL